MMLWKIVVVGLGLLTLRRMIKGLPSWDVPLSDGRVVRVLEARPSRHIMTDPADPDRLHGQRFDVRFVGDFMTPAERLAGMPELATWAAARPDAMDCGRVFVVAAVRVVDSRIWGRWSRHAEWREFRRLPDGQLELLREGRYGRRIYPAKQTDRSRPNG